MAGIGGHDLGAVNVRNGVVGRAGTLGMRAPGLAQLRRDLRRLSPETDKMLRVELRIAAQPVRDRARQLAPRRTGNLAAKLRISVSARGVGITDAVPYANVIHWGGSTGVGHRPNVPWSGSVFIEPSPFISDALEEDQPQILGAMGNAVERAARRTGWHGGSSAST